MKVINLKTKNENYSIIIDKNAKNYLNARLPKNLSKILIITDKNVANFHLEEIKKQIRSEYYVFIIPNGDDSKTIKWWEKIITYGIEIGLDRNSIIIALGGGVVGDLAGFVAATYMRGIKYIQIPTTILAHDSSIGGKVALNHPLGKNMIGTFYQPFLVLYDLSFLLTLSQREFSNGLAEVIKHTIINDLELFNFIKSSTKMILNRDLTVLEEMLYRSMLIKKEIVEKDEKEQNIRALLNLGHTLGHALEIISNHQILHGEAVSIGIIYASKLALRYFNLTNEEYQNIKSLLKAFDLPITFPERYPFSSIIELMKRDKKIKNKIISMIIPERIGLAKMIDQITIEQLEETYYDLINERG